MEKLVVEKAVNGCSNVKLGEAVNNTPMNIKIDKGPLFASKSENGRRPLLIAGPCSVESKEQIMTTALALRQCGVDILRGGIWKPSTRPNAFEGVGGKGMAW